MSSRSREVGTDHLSEVLTNPQLFCVPEECSSRCIPLGVVSHSSFPVLNLIKYSNVGGTHTHIDKQTQSVEHFVTIYIYDACGS